MAFELYGMLAGSVSPMTGEHIKPAYGGDDEAFLRKLVSPIYNTIAKVFFLKNSGPLMILLVSIGFGSCMYNSSVDYSQEAGGTREEKSKHSQWRNYDDLNEYFWCHSFLCYVKL